MYFLASDMLDQQRLFSTANAKSIIQYLKDDMEKKKYGSFICAKLLRQLCNIRIAVRIKSFIGL